MKTISKDTNEKDYLKYLAKYLNTKNGQAYVYHIISQLIIGFKIDRNDKIIDLALEDTKPLVIDFSEE